MRIYILLVMVMVIFCSSKDSNQLGKLDEYQIYTKNEIIDLTKNIQNIDEKLQLIEKLASNEELLKILNKLNDTPFRKKIQTTYSIPENTHIKEPSFPKVSKEELQEFSQIYDKITNLIYISNKKSEYFGVSVYSGSPETYFYRLPTIDYPEINDLQTSKAKSNIYSECVLSKTDYRLVFADSVIDPTVIQEWIGCKLTKDFIHFNFPIILKGVYKFDIKFSLLR